LKKRDLVQLPKKRAKYMNYSNNILNLNKQSENTEEIPTTDMEIN